MIMDVQLCARKVGKYSSYLEVHFLRCNINFGVQTQCEYHVCNY